MIEFVHEGNLKEVLPLIRAYQEFYEVSDIDDDRNEGFFSQFGEQNPFGCQFLYRIDGRVVAFATVYFTFTSTIAQKVGVMNDLFVVSDVRGKGAGRALITHCLDYALSKGACRLQWVTATDNEVAQRLYDSLNTNKKPWLFYSYKI
ncbi:MAG: GNAT family N-acetyltransferase [Hymenobacteraceae bacterium]|nr:GNAT family N-acetyltransferase [Hymenobacteraceae bacterium]